MQKLDIVNKWDEESLKMLYNDYYKALVTYSFTIVGTVEMAEDVVQDVLTGVWQKKIQFDSEARLKSYLYTAVHNRSIHTSSLKANNMRPMSQLKTNSPQLIDSQGEELLYKEEMYRQLFQAIDNLPARQKRIFLNIIEGKTNAEIAEAMGISINTVKSQRKRGMEILKATTSADVFLLLMTICNNI